MGMTEFVLLNLVIYLPFHLFEEAVGDFPKWMFEHRWLPFHMTHGHWMANNVFIYFPMLLLAVFLYILGGSGFECFGAAILIWGLINFGDHFFYTVKDKKVSPGLITGTVFLINSLLGLRCYVLSGSFSFVQLIFAVIIGGILFGLPIGLCVAVYRFFEKYIKS